MKNYKLFTILSIFILACFTVSSRQARYTDDSLKTIIIPDFSVLDQDIEQQRIADSIQKEELKAKLNSLKPTDNAQIEELQRRLKEIEDKENKILEEKKQEIEFLKNSAIGYPVVGIMGDTLFRIFSKRGELSAQERATTLTKKIRELYDDDFLVIDSFKSTETENTYTIMYGNTIVLSLNETDALWYDKNLSELGNEFRQKISDSIRAAKHEFSLSKILIRIGLVVLVIAIMWFFIWLIRYTNRKLLYTIGNKKEKWLKKLAYKDYTFLNEEQEYQGILFITKLLRWFVYIVIIYISLSAVFSIFPFTRGWADKLIQLILSPLKGIFISIWNYLPNLFSILAIFFVMKYFIKFVKYIFTEIESEKLKLSGFHPDWAMPTFSIVRFLLYAFMFVLIFPFLPGSDSNIFKGVSVFIGVLFSLGSTSAIANLVAGLVITYMRPFKVGDRIKIGDITGDVIEKSLLVTRVKTPKNEEVTIPNSSVLSGNTTNYSTLARTEGLIIHTTVTIGYDVPWKKMYQALLNAADRTDLILKEPKPFVLQTSLDDFYVAYQINGYTRETNRHNRIYSVLHQNIQDCCNEMGIEILSPHYRAARDGNATTIPADYLPKDYKAPGFNVNVENSEK
jgi:small-conductance mechanosensitive channel/Skp family chaperone for outer membrane proteins